MRKFMTAAMVALVSIGGAARADNITGNDLFEACSGQGDPSKAGFCAGYVIGAVEGIHIGVAWPMMLADPKQPSEQVNKTVETLLQSCPAPEVINGQYVGVVTKYLSEHPETRHETARLLIMSALQEAFPCKAN